MSTTAKQDEKAYQLLEYPGLLERRKFDRKLLLLRYEIPCSSEFAENILSSLSSIEFCPLKQPELIGLDGTIHGIKTGNYWLSCSLRWCYIPTDNWKPLAQWFEKPVNMFEQILPQSTCRSI